MLQLLLHHDVPARTLRLMSLEGMDNSTVWDYHMDAASLLGDVAVALLQQKVQQDLVRAVCVCVCVCVWWWWVPGGGAGSAAAAAATKSGDVWVRVG